MRKSIAYFFYSSLCFFCIVACSTTKYVGSEQKLLDGSKIVFKQKPDIDNKTLLNAELESFYLQKPNGHLFWFIPREWFYFKNADPGDSSWYNKWGRNTVGEKPVFLDQNKVYETSSSMQKFLRNTKGFYHAEVSPEIVEKGHKAKVKYNITPGDRYHINDIEYIGTDTSIINILKSIRQNSIINIGDPINSVQFYEEKTRLITELQKRGYANFLPNYLKINGDSTIQKNKIDVLFQVLPPLPDTLHRQYKVGDIRIYTDFYNEQNIANTVADTINGLIFCRENEKFIVNPNIIDDKIYLKSGNLWSATDRNKTFRKLSNLDSYRFVSLIPVLDPDRDSLIHYDIFLTPHLYKYTTDQGIDVNYSSVNTATGRQLFGISGNALFNVKNLFHGSETYTFNIENGYEFNLDTLRVSTFNLGIGNNLEIPKHVDFLGAFNLTNKIGLLSDDRFVNIKEETNTNFNLSLNYTNIRNFYTISSFNASASYNYVPNTRKRINIRQTSFALNSFNLKQGFLDRVGDNQLIINSFKDNLITGYLFNELSFAYSSIPNFVGRSHTLIGGLEISGWETHFLNKLYNFAASSDSQWAFSDRISFAKFVRGEIDARIYKKVNSKNSLAFRFNTGLAVPFGGQEVVPFIRQFSVGGPNSLRAWDQKQLGPGGYSELLESNTPGSNQVYFQQGDFKLELNAEYRFDVLWLLEGALFIDAGNVWTLKEDTNRPGAQFTSTFYKQMAVAAGWGMRWDFEYFNIRFDFAYRIRNPYTTEANGYWYSWKRIRSQKFGNLQVAVNYPF